VAEPWDVIFADSDQQGFVDRRREIRVVVRIAGRFSLANRRDPNGNRRQFACRAVNISESYMMLATPVAGAIGERIIAYFEEFGKIQGSIARVLDGGFVMRIVADNDERSKFVRKLIWLEQNKNYDVPDVRAQKRIVPQDPISTLIFPDGSMQQCFVIDMSASGVAVSPMSRRKSERCSRSARWPARWFAISTKGSRFSSGTCRTPISSSGW
jgi:hypothetical protein